VVVWQNDYNRGNSTYDLRIGAESAPQAAIEVVGARDPDMEGQFAAIPLERQYFEPDPGIGVRGSWNVTVRPSANVKRLIQRLPGIIAAMQAIEDRNLDDSRHNRHTAVLDESRRLDIEEIDYVGGVAMGRARIYLHPMPQGGPIPGSVEPLARWCDEFLRDPAREDVLAKLSVDVPERHVFIPVAFGGAPHEIQAYLMRDVFTGSPPEGLSDAALNPPDPVTHVWITSSSARVGLRWDGRRWCYFNARPTG